MRIGCPEGLPRAKLEIIEGRGVTAFQPRTRPKSPPPCGAFCVPDLFPFFVVELS